MQRSITFIAIAACFSSVAVQAQQSDTSSVSLKAHPGWVQIPGALIRPDCVHEVPKGALVSESGDVTLHGALIAHYDDCPETPIHTRPRHGFAPAFTDQNRLLPRTLAVDHRRDARQGQLG